MNGAADAERMKQYNERDHREVDTALASFRGAHANRE